MGAYFIVSTTFIFLIFCAIAYNEVSNGEGGLAVLSFLMAALFWVLLSLAPATSSTEETNVQVISSHYADLTKHKVVVNSEDCTKIVTDSYLIEKIRKGEYKLEKHVHKNIFGGESTKPTYYIVPTFKN